MQGTSVGSAPSAPWPMTWHVTPSHRRKRPPPDHCSYHTVRAWGTTKMRISAARVMSSNWSGGLALGSDQGATLPP